MRPFLGVLMFTLGCSESPVQPLTAAPPVLTAITYNMYYGLASDLLPEDLRTGTLSATSTAIINAISLTDYRCRIEGAARQIVAENPDVIGLQEALFIAYARELDDRSDVDTLVDAGGMDSRQQRRGEHDRVDDRPERSSDLTGGDVAERRPGRYLWGGRSVSRIHRISGSVAQ
jgi:hypothetical protein